MSPGLMRAREPYRVKNAITGIALGAFAVGIWAYSLSAVRQDVFDDVDEEARAMQRAGTKPVGTVEEGQHNVSDALGMSASTTTTMGNASPAIPVPPTVRNSLPHRGLLQQLDAKFPRLLDPDRKTLVYGAPPVDDIGKITTR